MIPEMAEERIISHAPSWFSVYPAKRVPKEMAGAEACEEEKARGGECLRSILPGEAVGPVTLVVRSATLDVGDEPAGELATPREWPAREGRSL